MIPSNFLIRTRYLVVILCGISVHSFAQIKTQKEETYQVEAYEKRILMDSIYGVYIPRDIRDAMIQLDIKVDAAGREKFAAMSEEDASSKVYFSFGRWMSVNWGLEDGSRLSHYFQKQGIGKLEDMIRILMITYHRHINQKPLQTEALIVHYKQIRKKEYEQYLEKARKEGKDLDGGN